MVLWVLAMCPANAPGQAPAGGIRGVVADSAGAMVPGAAVEARNRATQRVYKTVSRESGTFLIERVPAGEYDLKVMMSGFRPFIRHALRIETESFSDIRAVLEVDAISQTVTVMAPAPLQFMDYPQREPEALQIAVSSVSRSQMELQGAKTVVDGLNYVPGAWVESRGRKVKKFLSFRGQRYPYPEYSIDGALFREFHEVPYFLSASDIERVDALRSGGSLLSGISGLAGVIDVVPRQYDKRETTFLAEYGSLNTYRVHVSHGQKLGKLSYGLGAGGLRTDGPDDRRGDERMMNLFAHISWRLKPSLTLRATALYLRGRSELVQAVPPAARQYRIAQESYDPIKTSVISIKTTYQPNSRASTQFTVGYSDRHNSFVTETTVPRRVTPDYDSEWNLNLIQSLALSTQNVLRVSANYNHWESPYGKRFFAGRRSELATHSVSILDEHSFGRLVLDGGVRYQQTYIDEYGAFNIGGSATGFGKVAAIKDVWEPPQLSGSLGASYRVSDGFSLKGSFLTGAIEPRTSAIMADGRAPATESRTMLDAGFSFAGDALGEFSLTGFLLRQQDAIVLSGSTTAVNGVLTELYENRDQDTRGIEIDFRSRPVLAGHRLIFNLAAMKAGARLQEAMERDPEKPQVVLGAGLMGMKRHVDYNIFWKFVSAYQSSRFADPAVLQPLGHFHTLNLSLGRTLGQGEKARIYLEVMNMTDSRYQTVVGYPDYGRRVQLGIRQGF